MEEGSHTFEFFTIDNEGNTSLPIDTTGEVFGDVYFASLRSRIVEKAAMINNEVTIYWLAQSNDDAVVSEIQYKDSDGVVHSIRVDKSDTETRISTRPQKRSEERRVGKECVSTCRSRRSP